MAEKTKIFSLAEANEIVPRVAHFTSDVVRDLERIRQEYKVDPGNPTTSMPEAVLREVEEALRSWCDRIIDLGAYPKGYFTVDFQSADPELLYCWSYGEDTIRFTHKVWENFSHRRPLAASLETGGDHLRWVN